MITALLLYLHNLIDNFRDGEVLLLDDQILHPLHDEARPLVDERAEETFTYDVHK